MIRRQAGDSWILITQVDHAHLAADLADCWGGPQIALLPEAALLCAAVRDHDEGWRRWETTPRINPERGDPRQFLEMPMAEAVPIWTRSIDVCHRRERAASDALAAFEQCLATRSRKLTPARATIARAALSLPGEFDAAAVLRRLTELGGAVPSVTEVYRVLTLLSTARLLVRNARVRDRRLYRIAGPPLGPSPWPGLWVSRHFTFLAEMALAHRKDADERATLLRFLDEQRALQAGWRNEARAERNVADSDVDFNATAERLEHDGFRWLQFFDRLSLWLCCAPVRSTETLARPDDQPVHFTPLESGDIAVEPYPFRTESFEVAVSARSLPAARLENDAELAARLGTGERVELRWRFVRW